MRFASPKGNFVEYQVGLFYALAVDSEQYGRDLLRLVGPRQISNVGQAQYSTYGNDVALFGEANLHFTDRFRGVICGLRFVIMCENADSARIERHRTEGGEAGG